MIIHAVSLVLAMVGFWTVRFGIAKLENGHLAPFIGSELGGSRN
jgi:hypothetical protein